MSKQLSDKFGQGLTPEQFINSMKTNQNALRQWMDAFSWDNEEDREFFESLQNRDDLRCLLVAAEWCGDVVRNVPVIFRSLENSGIPVEVLILEQHLDVIDQFLTMGGRAIPVAIFTDTGGHVLGTWGPRLKHVQAVMTAFKQKNPDREAPDYQDKIEVARQEMMRQYGEGTGYQKVIVKELRDLLSSF